MALVDVGHRHTGPGCDNHFFFRQFDGYTTHFYVFWDADSESGIENFELKK